MNKKGFVLAEAIIVSVFVIGLFTFLSINLFPLIAKYQSVSKYDNPQETYIVNFLRDEINLRNINVENGYYKISEKINDKTREITCEKDRTTINTGLCELSFKKIIYDDLNISEILVVDSVLLTDDIKYLNRAMREYYNYYNNRNKIDKKVMLVRFSDEDDKGVVRAFGSISLGD